LADIKSNQYELHVRSRDWVPGDLSSWDVSRVQDGRFMFSSAASFASDVSRWNVSALQSMQGMFLLASSFDSDMSMWDTSNVVTMRGTFLGCPKFNSDLSTWNVGTVTDMNLMFSEASSFNGDLSNWNVSVVTDMFGMFDSAKSFEGRSLSSWNVGSVTTMEKMFRRCDMFNGDLSAWTTSSVVSMASMFLGCPLFNSKFVQVERWKGDFNVIHVQRRKFISRGPIGMECLQSSGHETNVGFCCFIFKRLVKMGRSACSGHVIYVLRSESVFERFEPVECWPCAKPHQHDGAEFAGDQHERQIIMVSSVLIPSCTKCISRN
jgi:surface protein